MVFHYSGHRKLVREEGKHLTQGGLAETCKQQLTMLCQNCYLQGPVRSETVA